jgi:hypothetical protein
MKASAVATLLVVLAGCGGKEPAALCGPVPASVTEALQAALQVEGGGGLEEAAAVRSGAHENATFVSARITGPGLPPAAVGVWLKTGSLEGPGLYFSVNSTAKAFSVFPDAATTDTQATMADPGAEDALRCVME